VMDRIADLARFCIFISCLAALGASTGCGYSSGSLLPAKHKDIYVDNFKNTVALDGEVTEGNRYTLYRPGLENEVTNAVVDRFVFDGNLKVAKKEDADIILTGELINYVLEPLRYDRNDNVEEYRINISVNMALKDVADEKELWEEANFTGESTYKTTGRFAISEDAARQEAIEDLARRIVERTIEGW